MGHVEISVTKWFKVVEPNPDFDYHVVVVGEWPRPDTGEGKMDIDRFEIAEVDFSKHVVCVFYPKGGRTVYGDVVVFDSLDAIGTIFLPPEATYLLVDRPEG
jgi:hypothetical protein